MNSDQDFKLEKPDKNAVFNSAKKELAKKFMKKPNYDWEIPTAEKNELT